MKVNYKYNEDKLLAEFAKYVDKTYDQHYATGDGQTQSMDSIIEEGHGTGFCMGNIRKYSSRYGKKGETPDEWRKDIVKTMHYCLFQLYIHDREHQPSGSDL
jgi:hypothetical protein